MAYEHALCPAYNSWIAEVCGQTGGRLRWNAMVRLTDVESAARLHETVEEALAKAG